MGPGVEVVHEVEAQRGLPKRHHLALPLPLLLRLWRLRCGVSGVGGGSLVTALLLLLLGCRRRGGSRRPRAALRGACCVAALVEERAEGLVLRPGLQHRQRCVMRR